jgi:hypothetical protein
MLNCFYANLADQAWPHCDTAKVDSYLKVRTLLEGELLGGQLEVAPLVHPATPFRDAAEVENEPARTVGPFAGR